MLVIIVSIYLDSFCVARTKFLGALRLPLGAGPVPFIEQLVSAERDVAGSQTLVEGKGFFSRGFRLWKYFSGRQVQDSEYHVSVSQSRISQSVIRILLNRLVEIPDTFVQSILRIFLPVITSLEVKLIGVRVPGKTFG